MRGSLVLLVALAACSDSSGPRQVPTLTTQLSASVDSINSGGITVTLNASNPTDTTIHLSFTVPAVLAQIRVNAQWINGLTASDGLATSYDTLSLTSGATAPLGTVSVNFFSDSGFVPAILPGTEQFTLSPGVYSMRACYFPAGPTGPDGGITHGACGNGVPFTLVR